MGYSERQRQTEANLRYEEYRMGLTPKDNWEGNEDGYIKHGLAIMIITLNLADLPGINIRKKV